MAPLKSDGRLQMRPAPPLPSKYEGRKVSRDDVFGASSEAAKKETEPGSDKGLDSIDEDEDEDAIDEHADEGEDENEDEDNYDAYGNHDDIICGSDDTTAMATA